MKNMIYVLQDEDHQPPLPEYVIGKVRPAGYSEGWSQYCPRCAKRTLKIGETQARCEGCGLIVTERRR